ncbi:MAG: hypothetical protein M1821_006896 [Bathelium mastoideum]|nr:MAG: hypothetical protein M1821_006896 [Bathelium mastoideum]
MRIILTGCTGFIGGEVLEQCLQNPSITSTFALSRRTLDPAITSNPKLKVAIVNDFVNYSDEVLRNVAGVDACIWVHFDYTLAAAKAFHQASGAAEDGKKLRFIYLSGAAVERDQNKSLWLMQEQRKMRGQVENELITYAEVHRDSFETYVIRPAFVLAKETSLVNTLKSLAPSVKVDVLAMIMVDTALRGSKDQIMENGVIKQAKV